jgi:hypothetical protein
VSTQTRFDLHGLIEAIESSDSAYQIALYAEHAEVQIADGDSIGQAPQVLAGRQAIARWIEDMATRRLIHHIIDPYVDRRSLSFVDELHDPAGTTVIHRCTAEISAGQISQETVTVEATVHSTNLHLERRATAPAIMTDEDPDPRPRAWARPTSPAGRYLAGNFFG